MKNIKAEHATDLLLPNDSYIYRIIPYSSRHCLAVISSDDSLRLLDPKHLQSPPDKVIPDVHKGVTCLEDIPSISPNVLATAGRDAVVRIWDTRMDNINPPTTMTDPNHAPYLSLASNGAILAAGTELTNSQACITLWDLKNPSKPMVQYVECHNDDITELRFHPTVPRLLLSGSTDGLVNIINTTHTDEDDAIQQITNHGSSIHHADFLDTTTFYALSHDETFSIYPVEEADNSAVQAEREVTAMGDLRERFGCEYVVDVIPPSDSRPAMVVAGSHTNQYIDLISLLSPQWQPDSSVMRLNGGHGEEVVRTICILDNVAITGGEDGKLRSWNIGNNSNNVETADVIMSADSHSTQTNTRESKKEMKKKDVRFRPY